jgi:CHASE2 domain-containing sensor protein
MSDRRPDEGGLSCLGCGGCLTLFVIVASFVFFAVAGADWLPQAVAVAIIVAFLIGIIALERERRR